MEVLCRSVGAMPVQQFQGTDSQGGRVDGLGVGTTYDAAVSLSAIIMRMNMIVHTRRYTISDFCRLFNSIQENKSCRPACSTRKIGEHEGADVEAFGRLHAMLELPFEQQSREEV